MPVVAGFTAGIAVYIFSTQVRDFLGLRLVRASGFLREFLGKLAFFGHHLEKSTGPPRPWPWVRCSS